MPPLSSSPWPAHAADIVSTQPTALSLGLLELDGDRYGRRIAPRDRERLVNAAIGTGVDAEQKVRAAFGRIAPADLAARWGVAVEESNVEGGYGSVMVFADYMPRPPKVRLYTRAIEALDRHLDAYPDADLLKNTGTRPVFLAHELFHHWERLHPEHQLSRRHRVQVLSLGPFKLTAGLRALSEIAAGAFAQSLLDLRHHPKLLETLIIRR